VDRSIISSFYHEAFDRARRYAKLHGLSLQDQLGSGYDGIVLSTTSQSAIKALRYEPLYIRERDVYLRLKENGIGRLSGFAVPKLINFDDTLWVLEMEIVSPPFVLDFAGAYLDRPPDFDEETLEAWEAEKLEQFEDRWPEVDRLISAFKRYGIYLSDVKPGNVVFEEQG
jgi:hypothetical protein